VSELARIEKVVLLESADLFAYCKAQEILRVAGIAHERRFGEGETIYDVNDPATVLYCVVQGEVRVELPIGETRHVGPLTCFGVEEILTGRLRTGRAVAAQETLTLAIDADDFFDLLAHDVEIVRALFRKVLTEREGKISP
jgi:CRP-like cAMP-binding protein